MYVVFDVDSTMEVKTYKFYHHAKARADRLNEKEARRFPDQPQHRREYAAYHVDFYRQYVLYWEQKRNILAKPGEGYFWELSNTPYYLSPSSETYHSA
jgi:hypothetical protein